MIGRVPAGVRGEYVMALNRLLAGCLMLVASGLIGRDLAFGRWALPILAWTLCGLLILVHLRLKPEAAAWRRGVAIILDATGATIILVAGGEATAFIYVVYLWVIIGNGFRFGKRYIFAASIASIAGFSAAIALTPFWRTHLSLSFGLLAGIVVLPAYSFALIRQIAEARRLAEQADRAKSLFLASVSHELRTPLNAIIGTAELLDATALSADQAEMVATISSAADGQLCLVRDVLEYSRIEAGHGRAERTPFSLADLLATVRAIVAADARRKGLLVNIHITARTPLRLVGDERHLREVLLNLSGNAIKFTDSGSVTIAADGTSTAGGTVQLRLEVADTGIGIAADARQKIFEVFTQANASILDRFGGTGLGLALCERQVRLMGGSIGVESALGAGSVFWVELPLVRAADMALQCPEIDMIAIPANAPWAAGLASRLALTAPHTDQGGADARGRQQVAFVQEGSNVPPRAGTGAAVKIVLEPTPGLPGRSVREQFVTSLHPDSGIEELRRAARIVAALSLAHATPARPMPGAHVPDVAKTLTGVRVLVADDNAVNRTIVTRMLAGAGAVALLAHNGEEALALLSEGGIDAALLDVNMPVMDGIEAAQFYNFSAPAKRVPLIGLTADASPGTRDRCLRAGMAACLVKPVRTAELLDMLHTVLPERAVTNARPAPESAPAHAILDLGTLADLHGLGGTGFVQELVEAFAADGRAVLDQIEQACLARDVQLLRSRAHSLCSIAANVGAWSLRDLCLPWKELSESALDRNASRMLDSIRREWTLTLAELRLHVAALAAQRSGVA